MRENCGKRHGNVSNNVAFFTRNRKDFDFIEGLKLYNPRF